MIIDDSKVSQEDLFTELPNKQAARKEEQANIYNQLSQAGSSLGQAKGNLNLRKKIRKKGIQRKKIKKEGVQKKEIPVNLFKKALVVIALVASLGTVGVPAVVRSNQLYDQIYDDLKANNCYVKFFDGDFLVATSAYDLYGSIQPEYELLTSDNCSYYCNFFYKTLKDSGKYTDGQIIWNIDSLLKVASSNYIDDPRFTDPSILEQIIDVSGIDNDYLMRENSNGRGR